MTWEIHNFDRLHVRVGEFGTKDISKGTLGIPKQYRGKKSLVFTDKKRNIAKIVFSENEGTSRSTLSMGEWIIEAIGEDMAVAYYDEDAIYLGPHSKGEEYLKKLLKADGVL